MSPTMPPAVAPAGIVARQPTTGIWRRNAPAMPCLRSIPSCWFSSKEPTSTTTITISGAAICEGVQNSPVQLTVANQLVYSAHDYGPLESSQAWFNGSTSYNSLVSTWTAYWAYISLNGIAPVWVGEFGTPNDDADIQGTAPGSRRSVVLEPGAIPGCKRSLSWTYWALNGEDRYGLLDSTYDATPVSALKQQLLRAFSFR